MYATAASSSPPSPTCSTSPTPTRSTQPTLLPIRSSTHPIPLSRSSTHPVPLHPISLHPVPISFPFFYPSRSSTCPVPLPVPFLYPSRSSPSYFSTYPLLQPIPLPTMHFSLVHIATALYAFSSSPTFHAGENEIGLAPLLSFHPNLVVNALTSYTQSFASSSFSLKLFGAPLPSSTVLSADTGQAWDTYSESLIDGDPPPASTVYTPTSPIPRSSPSLFSAILDTNTPDTHLPTPVAYDDDTRGPAIASELTDAAVLDSSIAFRTVCAYMKAAKDHLVAELDSMAYIRMVLGMTIVDCCLDSLLMTLALIVTASYGYLTIDSAHSKSASTPATSFKFGLLENDIGIANPAISTKDDNDELVLSPEDIALPEAEIGELDLAPEDVPLPDATDNELDLTPEDIPLPAAEADELSLAPEDFPLPTATDNELDLAPEDIPLPVAEADELSLAPEDVPLPVADAHELDLSPEDVPLPDTVEDDLNPLSKQTTAYPLPSINHIIVPDTAPLYIRADNVAYEPAEDYLVGKVYDDSSSIFFLPSKPLRVPTCEGPPSQILAAEGSEPTSDDQFSASELQVTKQPVIPTEANEDHYSWNAVEDDVYEWSLTDGDYDLNAKGDFQDRSSSVDEILGDLFAISDKDQSAIPSAIAGLSTLASSAPDSSDASCSRLINTHLIPMQLDLAPADESPVQAHVDCKLPAFDLDLPAFEFAPVVSAAPVTPTRTHRKGLLLDCLRPFDLTPKTLELAYLELSPEVSFSAISEDADALSFDNDYLALSPISYTTHESALTVEPALFLPPSSPFDDIVHRAVIDGAIPIFMSGFVLPADWEDVDDHLEFALANGGGDENLLEVDQPPHLLPSGPFDDVVHLVVPEGIIPPCPGDEFAALRIAYRKHSEVDGENLQDVSFPTLPSSMFFGECSTPVLSRATRRPMDNKPMASPIFEPIGSSTPMARKDKGKRRAMPVISESGESSSGSTLPSDEGSTDVSAPSTFYREPTPGFDFDLGGPGPSSPFSCDLSPSSWPSPRAPWLFFEDGGVEVASGSPRFVGVEGFDQWKSPEVPDYALGRHDVVLDDDDDNVSW